MPVSLILLALAPPVEGVIERQQDSVVAGAAAATDADAIIVDDIIVTALPAPVAAPVYGAQLIDGAQLAGAASGRIEGALYAIPGLQQFRRSDGRSANPSAQGITLRSIGGNAASRTLVTLDGVPQGDAFFGAVPFATFAPDAIARAQVTRGSGAGPFGSGALAGVIALDSIDPRARTPLIVALNRGSNAAWQASLGAAIPLGRGAVALDIGRDRSSGFATTPDAQQTAGTVTARYAASRAALTASVPVTPDVSLSARVTGFRDRRTLRFAGADSHSDGIDAQLRLISTGRWGVDALAWVQQRDFSTVVVSAATLRPTLDQRTTPSTGWGAKLELRPPSAAGQTIRLGFDMRGATGRVVEDALTAAGARTLTRMTGGETQIGGAFAEWDVALGALLVSAGARADHWQQSDGFLIEERTNGALPVQQGFSARRGWLGSARGGVAWAARDWMTLRIAGYAGNRLPTLNELYRPFVVFPITTRANPALDPERLIGAEIGVAVTPLQGFSLTATAFDNRLHDAIGNVTIAPNLRERRNMGTVRARGVEVVAVLDRGAWRMDAAAALTRARIAATGAAAALDGLRPAQSPAVSLYVALARRIGDDGRIAVTLRHIGAAYEDDLNRDRLPPATTVDAVAEWPFVRGWALIARGENLFDARVVTRNAAGSIDLGAPRLLSLGLRWTPD